MTTDVPALGPLSLAAFACAAGLVAVLARRASWLAPAAIACSAPFAWYHRAGPDLATFNKAVFIGALVGSIWAMAVDPGRRRAAKEAFANNQALFALAAFAAFAGISVLWAQDRADAVRDALRWMWYAGAFALSAAGATRPGDSLKLAALLFASSAVVGTDGFWQHLTGAPRVFVAPDGTIVGRITSTLEGPNQFGAYLESVIPPLLAALLFVRLPRTGFIAGSLLLGLLATDLSLTFSRGAFWSGAAAAAFVVAAYIWTRRNADDRTLAALPNSAAAVAACLSLVAFPIAGISLSPAGWQHVSAVDAGESASVRMREQLWSCARRLVARHLLAGVGAGNFAQADRICRITPADQARTHANQLYLETAADLGIAGLALLAWFLLSLLGRIRSPALWADPIAIGAYAALLAFVLHGFVDDVMPYPKAVLAFFVLAGLIPKRT